MSSMNLTPMRYRDYTWPHNPETYEIVWQRKVAVHKIPYGRCCMQDLGKSYRIMRGEGTFVGEGAYDELRKLAKVFAKSGPGVLIHPVWQAANAYFISLELKEDPLPNYVHYTFEFWEDGDASTGLTILTSAQKTVSSSGKTTQASYYTVRKGDTLWGIAKKHGVTLKTLLRLNPQIKNPNLIYPGNQVRIR